MPSLRSAAGARFTVITCPGHSRSAECTPLRTRCFASWHARSARPTIENDGLLTRAHVCLDLDASGLEADERERDRAAEHASTVRANPSREGAEFVPRA